MIAIAPILALLGKRSTWITLLVAAGVILAGFAVMNYVAVKSENMALSSQVQKANAVIDQYKANAKANKKSIATRNELIDALAQVETKDRVVTIKALKDNPAWASQPIPADVLSSLRD